MIVCVWWLRHRERALKGGECLPYPSIKRQSLPFLCLFNRSNLSLFYSFLSTIHSFFLQRLSRERERLALSVTLKAAIHRESEVDFVVKSAKRRETSLKKTNEKKKKLNKKKNRRNRFFVIIKERK